MDEADAAFRHSVGEMNALLSQVTSKAESMMTAPLINFGPRFCIDCDCEIPEARIKALPGAMRCVHCQEKFEQETSR